MSYFQMVLKNNTFSRMALLLSLCSFLNGFFMVMFMQMNNYPSRYMLNSIGCLALCLGVCLYARVRRFQLLQSIHSAIRKTGQERLGVEITPRMHWDVLKTQKAFNWTIVIMSSTMYLLTFTAAYLAIMGLIGGIESIDESVWVVFLLIQATVSTVPVGILTMIELKSRANENDTVSQILRKTGK